MNKKIKIPWAKPAFVGRERAYCLDAIESSWISGGPYVERFARDFGSYIHSDLIVTTSNGTTALLLAMLVGGFKNDDEILLPGFSFVAAANMAITIGARPVFVDIDPETWSLDPSLLEGHLTKKTKAVVAVDMYGNVCDLKAIGAFCRSHDLIFIEDAAESVFSKFDGHYAGTLADIGTFSFQATKTLAMGEGGCVTSKYRKLHQRMKVIASHGMVGPKYYWHEEIGHNFRLPNLQAAIGCAQLEKIGKIIKEKGRVYARYQKNLGSVEGIAMQAMTKACEPVVWAVALKLDPKAFGKRDEVMAELLEQGIETRPGFTPFSKMPIYKGFLRKPTPVSERVADTVISLPSYIELSDDQIDGICKALMKCKR